MQPRLVQPRPLLCRLVLLVLPSLAAFGFPAALPAHDGPHPHGHPPEGHPDYYYDPADETVDGSLLDDPHWYDGDVLATDGGLWYAWLDYTAGEGDDVWVGLRKDGRWVHRHRITSDRGGFANPTLTAAAGGRLWLTYEAETAAEAGDRNQWDVFAVVLDKGRPLAGPRRVSTASGADINHDAAADPDGGLWVVWQSDRDGQFEIAARRLTPDGMGEPSYVSDQPHGDWHPTAAVRGDGTLFVAWDGYDGRDYDVYLRALAEGRWGPIAAVTSSPAFEGRAQFATDGAERVWLAWEEGGENWGRPYRGIDTTTVTDQIGPLHRYRRLRIATVSGKGSVKPLTPGLPMPSAHWAGHRDTAAKATTAGDRPKPGSRTKDRIGAYYERAALAVDGAGRLWVAYRHYYTPWLGYLHRSHVEQGWGVYARCYGGDGWSKLYRLGVDQGDGMQRLEVTPRHRGIAAVYTTGRTDRRNTDRPRGLVTAVITLAPDAAPAQTTPDAEGIPHHPHQRPRQAGKPGAADPADSARPSVTFDGQRYELFFGDLHRHTDLSLCRVAIDGTIDDAYRYATGPGRLDFLGITDHSRDVAQGEWLSQLWWRSRKEVGRHELGRDFFPFFAYERSHGNTADHNVISLRGDMLRPHTYPVPEFWKELDADTLTIPHQPIRRDTWKYQDDLLRPLVEIYQGCRDASIEQHVHQGLAKGYHLGFIASSDHMSTSASYACAWAEEPTRESIFHALQSRRTFGATDRITLVFRAGEHWMGEKFTAEQVPPLSLKATGTDVIESVTLLVDGKPHKTVHPHERQIAITEQVDLKLTGSHYLYYHLVQSDGNEAWSSPVWVTAQAKP